MEDVKKGLAGVTKAITKGSGTFIKTTKISISLSNEEAKLKTIYTDIGKKVHEIYKHGGDMGEFFDEKYQQILILEKKIEELKVARDEAKGLVTCLKCGKTSQKDSAFCPKCGGAIGEASETAVFEQAETNSSYVPQNQPPPPVSAAPAPTVMGKTCNVCGSVNASTDRFCLSCGRIL